MTEGQKPNKIPPASIGSALRPLAVVGVRGLLGIVDLGKTALFYIREEIEDIYAEAQFEHLRRKMDSEISREKESEGVGQRQGKQS